MRICEVVKLENNRLRIRRARIVDIDFDRRRAFITIVYEEDRMRGNRRRRLVLQVDAKTVIRDEDKNLIPVRNLREGMLINAVVSDRFTRSNPPQTQAYRIVVKKDRNERLVSEGIVLYVDEKDNEIVVVSFRSDRSYDITVYTTSRQTEITNRRGDRIRLEDLRRGMPVTIEHSVFETASFPPRAEAYRISIR